MTTYNDNVELTKDKKSISGSMKLELSAPLGVFRYYDPINISGTIEKHCDGYKISGDFEAVFIAKSMNISGEIVTWTTP